MSYIIQRQNRFYVVAYDGLEPLTGKERRRWLPAGHDRMEAEAMAARLDVERCDPPPKVGRPISVGTFLTETWMPRKRRHRRPAVPLAPPAELDGLIERITVDAYGDEGYWSFLQAFEDEVQFPLAASLAGSPVTVTGVDFDGNERRGIVATIERGGHNATVSVIDLAAGRNGTAHGTWNPKTRQWVSP